MDNEFYTVRGYQLKSKQKITPAMEDYLEMIYRNNLENDYARINQLSKLLNVKDSSVSKMVQKLGELNLLNYEKYGYITLTDKGKKLGRFLLKRHKVIQEFLKLIGCREDVLKQTELMEHVLDEETIERMDNLINFFDNNDILEKYNMFKDNKNTL